MYLTNHQFVKELAQGNPDVVIHKLQIIHILLMRFGKKITQKDSLDAIKNNDESLSYLVSLLNKAGKLQVTTVKDLLNTCKKYYKHQKSFAVFSPIPQNELESYIKDSFEADIENKEYKKTGVRIQGEGLFYERNLEKDMNKLLG